MDNVDPFLFIYDKFILLVMLMTNFYSVQRENIPMNLLKRYHRLS